MTDPSKFTKWLFCKYCNSKGIQTNFVNDYRAYVRVKNKMIKMQHNVYKDIYIYMYIYVYIYL